MTEDEYVEAVNYLKTITNVEEWTEETWAIFDRVMEYEDNIESEGA